MKKEIQVMPFISLTIKKNSKESLTSILCTEIVYLYILFTENCIHHDGTVMDSHGQSLTVTDSHKQELILTENDV